MTAREILSDIRNLSTSGANPENFRIEDSQLLFWIDETRSTLIAQSLQKRPDINDTWLQTLSCLDLIQVDKSECCEIETGCQILRTELQLPDTVDNNQDNLIIRVEDSIGDIISRSNNFKNKYSNYTRYTTNKPKWFLKNNYIYIINSDFLTNINVTAIFERPSELAAYTSCGGNACYTTTSEYPCSLKMASVISDIILKTKVYPFIQTPRDITNDNSDNFSNPNTKNT